MPPFVDIRTIAATIAVVALALAVTMQAIRGKRRTSPGFGLWVAGTLSLAAAGLLISLNHRAYDPLILPAGNVVSLLRLVLITAGLERFLGRRPRWAIHGTGLALVAVSSVVLTSVAPSTTARIAVVVALLAAWSAWSGLLAARGGRSILGAVPALLVTSLGLETAWAVGRFLLLLQGTDDTNSVTANATWQGLFFLAYTGLMALTTLGLVAVDVQRQEAELAASREEVRLLRGIIPICAGCKRVREDDRWTTVEAYVSARSEAAFSHGLCPECVHRLYPEHVEPSAPQR